MEEKILSAAEAAEFAEFQRLKREQEIALTLGKVLLDVSRREADRKLIQSRAEEIRRWKGGGLVVSPVNVGTAKRLAVRLVCVVGGNGESVIPVKAKEAKLAVKGGAGEIKLVLCYSALAGNLTAYLKKEIKKIRRTVKKVPLVVSLEDHAVTQDMVASVTKIAADCKADRICVRGETLLVSEAVRSGGGRVAVDASGVENAEQLRLLIKAGASRIICSELTPIAEELYRSMQEELSPQPIPVSSAMSVGAAE